MVVREYMKTQVTALQETDSLLDATMIFVRSSFRHLPVLRGKQLVGIVTERDVKQFAPHLMTRMTPEEYNQVLETTPISRVMTRNPVTVKPNQPVFDAATLLYTKKVGCLPVVENGELVGIISTTDMLALLVHLMKEGGLESASSTAPS